MLPCIREVVKQQPDLKCFWLIHVATVFVVGNAACLRVESPGRPCHRACPPFLQGDGPATTAEPEAQRDRPSSTIRCAHFIAIVSDINAFARGSIFRRPSGV